MTHVFPLLHSAMTAYIPQLTDEIDRAAAEKWLAKGQAIIDSMPGKPEPSNVINLEPRKPTMSPSSSTRRRPRPPPCSPSWNARATASEDSEDLNMRITIEETDAQKQRRLKIKADQLEIDIRYLCDTLRYTTCMHERKKTSGISILLKACCARCAANTKPRRHLRGLFLTGDRVSARNL